MSKPVPMVRPRSGAEIERVTSEILRVHGPATLRGDEPFDVITFADGALEGICGIDFEVQDLGPNVEGRFEGRTLILNTPVYQGALHWRNRDRFTTGHECGHAVLHADELDTINEWARDGAALYRRQDIAPFRDPEWQANRFSSSLLMPIDGVRAVLSSGSCLNASFAAMRISRHFRVSQQAAEIRIQTLVKGGLITV